MVHLDDLPKLAALAIAQGVIYAIACGFQTFGIVAAVTVRCQTRRALSDLCRPIHRGSVLATVCDGQDICVLVCIKYAACIRNFDHEGGHAFCVQGAAILLDCT